MEMQINVKNIRVNSISTLGSLNVGKILFTDNKASSKQFSKPDYEENELDVQEVIEAVPPLPFPANQIPK